jgi:VanZ family protein
MRVALWWLPFAVGCAAIFTVSGMSAPPIPDALVFDMSDKLLHGIAYAGLAGLAVPGTTRGFSHVTTTTLAIAACCAAAWGVSDELHQSFVPGRDCSIFDWFADTTGAAFGAVVAHAILRRFPQWFRVRVAAHG